MAGQYGKDRDLDFAYWANLGGKNGLTDEEAEGLKRMLGSYRHQSGMSEQDALSAALIHSENLYRVCCLIAYGNGLAGCCDIQAYARLTQAINPTFNPEIDPELGIGNELLPQVEVVLPYARFCDDLRKPDVLSTPRKYHGILDLTKTTFHHVERAIDNSKEHETYRMFVELGFPRTLGDVDSMGRELFWVIGTVIANAYTIGNYLGIYNGKPLFEERCGFDSLWQAIAELTDKQSPGICPVCGKVIDRRRDGKGGKPRKTCAAHSDKFQNMKKDLQKSGDPEMRYVDKCEEAVRERRWIDSSLNERPLMFS